MQISFRHKTPAAGVSLSVAMLLVAMLFAVSCQNDYDGRPGAAGIAFSADTLSFDTIFSGAATPAARLAVYNRSGENITVDRIELTGGSASPFNVNINGVPGPAVGNIRMGSGDSLLIYINVSPPETDAADIRQLTDHITVSSGGNTWQATLLAASQNVVKINGGKITDLNWTEGRPYLVGATAIVDSASTLTVGPGTRIYFADGASLSVFGSLHMNGTAEKPIVARGTRLEAFYDDIPGQWGKIAIEIGSKGNVVEHLHVSNGLYCFTVDSASQLTIRNSVLRDASHGAVLAFDAEVDIENSLLYNCGGALVATYGGQTTATHCTMYNYFNWQVRREPTIYANGEAGKYPPVRLLRIANSIVVGNLTSELALDSIADESAIDITHSYIRLGNTWKVDADDRFNAVLTGTAPQFADDDNFDFRLTAESPAIGTANADIAQTVPLDLDGNSRTADGAPDMGAYEFIPQEND